MYRAPTGEERHPGQDPERVKANCIVSAEEE
jgi:hypothetical protein